MADTTNAPTPAEAAKSVEETTRSVDATSNSPVLNSKSVQGDDAAASGEAAEGSLSPTTKQDPPTEEPTVTDANDDTATAVDDAATAPSATNGTPASKKGGNNNRRKSGAGVPEHKKKTPSKKKKASTELQLNVQPGEIRFVAMRGYQPWPVVVCDEEMLPEVLLSKRPVSAKRIDGTYREDFMEGGKNAKDRRYPIMFLGTNEFAWQINTELQPFDIEEVKKEVEAGNTTKKTKALWEAYEIAAEEPDLDWFKDMLNKHDQALQEEMEKVAIDEQEKVVKKEKKGEKSGKRKSVAAVDDSDDIDMDDTPEDGAASAKKAKPSKKRKKGVESDGEQEKPAKTPKTKLKLTNNKTPKEPSTAKPKKEPKPKKTSKAKSESEEVEPVVEEKPLTEAERLEKREKSVLYLRHRLQKGFLSRDQAPKEEEMENMSDYLKQLEGHQDLEAEVIKKTKVHKVLKAIIKLSSIPKEEEYEFKKRSNELLTKWGGALAAETEIAGEAPAAVEPVTTNGVKHDEEKETPADPEAIKAIDADGDVAMVEETPAVKADAAPSAEDTAVDVSAT